MAPQNKMEEESNYNARFEQSSDETNDPASYFENRAFENDASDSKSVEIAAKSDVIAESMDFDDILPHIGEFGKYQKLLFLMMIPFAFFVAFVYFTQIFITLVPEEHFCKVPELMNLTKEER